MEISNFYDKWFSTRISSRPSRSKRILFNEVTLLLKRFFQTNRTKTFNVLDVGCGAGHFVDLLLKLGNTNVTGIDITDTTLKKCRELWPNAEFKSIDFSKPQNINKHYDVVTAVEVIEHIPNNQKEIFVANCQHALRKGGMLVMTTPNNDRVKQFPKQHRTTQPVEDWLNINELSAILKLYFNEINISTCIWFFPNLYIDAIYKRLFYLFHIGLEQRLLRPTQLGCHIVASAIREIKDETEK